MAIEVVVQKAAARTPATATPRDAGFFGHVRKGSIAVVMIQNVATPVADEQIVVAVVVVVADTASLAPARCREARFFRHIVKCAVAIVMKQVTSRLLSRRRGIERRAIH